jgi:hypothetical protein
VGLVMENKKYIDKVIGSLVRSTKIDYEKELLFFPFTNTPFFPFSSFLLLTSSSRLHSPPHTFTDYCKNIYGLTIEEKKYVWEQYRSIIKDKINNGE